MKKKKRFQSPPPADPITAVRDSSLAFRLNIGFFLRQLGIFLVMDLLLLVLAVAGLVFYAENRCADVAALVMERGVPSQDALVWMEASDYTILPLNREPEGYGMPVIPWLPSREETAQGLRLWDLTQYYQVELPNHGSPYAIRVNLSGLYRTLYWAGVALLVCQGMALVSNLFGNRRSIRKVLRPIQDLATAAARLNSMTHMSRQELENLAGELDKINAKHLDNRIDLPASQKELRSLARAINGMLDRVDQAYRAQMRFVSDASHELRTPIAVIQGYAALLDRWGKSDPAALQESIDAIRGEAASMEHLVEQLLFLARGGQRFPAGEEGAAGFGPPGRRSAPGGGNDSPGPDPPALLGRGAGGGLCGPGSYETGHADFNGQQRQVQSCFRKGVPAGVPESGMGPGYRTRRGNGDSAGRDSAYL